MEQSKGPADQVDGPLEPPADVPEIQRGNWFPLPANDPVVAYITRTYWEGPEPPMGWEAARLSQAVYVYRERATAQKISAKFYAVKTGSSADKHARREKAAIERAQEAGLASGQARVVRPLGLWRGILFLEYLDGLTLEDVIAVRRSRPGTLIPCLLRTVQLLATLHGYGIHPEVPPDFRPAGEHARKVIDQLTRYGVLQDDPLVRQGLLRAIERWEKEPAMVAFTPTCIHGDATTSNFVFPWDEGVVALDWERFDISDPAADLGRLMAEVGHSIHQHGGSVAEAEPFIEHLVAAYQEKLPAGWDRAALLQRARFHRAASILRIARNGWIPRLDRTALVAQALALLS
jgi:hypothetical protein